MKAISLKVCGMKYKDNIQALSSLNLQYMGFIFYKKSPRYAGELLDVLQLKAIDSSIQKVGVFVNTNSDEIAEICNKYDIKIIQLHGDETPQSCAILKSKGFTIVKAFSMNDDFEFGILQPYKEFCDFFLFDTKSENYGGTGINFNWDILKGYDNEIPFFLSGGINAANLESLQRMGTMNIHAIDINSKFEISPGLKDIVKIRSFKEQLDALSLNKK